MFLGASVEVLADEDDNFKGLFFCTDEMKKSVKAWGEVVFLDGTYCLFKMGLTLMIFLVEDSGTRSEIAGVGLVVHEDKETSEWLARSFKKAHEENIHKLQCIMADKDLKERDVLKKVFEDNVPVYICRFHVLKSFSSGFTKYMPKQAKLKQKCMDIVEKMVYSNSQEVYDKFYSKLKEIAPKEILDYFDKNWHAIIEEWTTFNMKKSNLYNFTNNRVESINKHIKTVVKKRSSLKNFLHYFFVWIMSHNYESDDKISKALMKRPVLLSERPEYLLSYMEYLLPEPFQHLEREIENVNLTIAQKISSEKFLVKDGNLELAVTPTSCSCNFRTSMLLPCKHIFFCTEDLKHSTIFSEFVCQEMV